MDEPAIQIVWLIFISSPVSSLDYKMGKRSLIEEGGVAEEQVVFLKDLHHRQVHGSILSFPNEHRELKLF